MKPLFRLFVIVLFLASCHTSPVHNAAESTGTDENKKALNSLFDTSSTLKNTATFHTVEIKQMKFVPEEVHVHKGDTVSFINNDIVVHDITEEKNKAWTSSPLPIGKSWEMVPLKSDDYYCSIHVVMKGKIVME